ncbi:MAG: glucose-6-phosphate isomerase [Candidatus Melainabacteria bacterium]|jgi:glucose-6-phosphate isomerase|nr:glucose-6-phosphate isomerase [Candidatus Melainabacteria bacterium]
MMMTISFDFTNYDLSAVGSTHGLNRTDVLAQYQPIMHQHITELFAKRHTEGAWVKWLNAGNHAELAQELMAYAKAQHGKHDDLIILGIGGSSLGGLALLKALLHPYWNNLSTEARKGYPRFHFVDNVEGDTISGLLDIVNLKRTLVNVVSKSGTTAETMSAFMLLKDRLEAVLDQPATQLKDHLVFTTDLNKGILRELATKLDVTTFEVPDDVAGRFSVFSAVGMLPAALCGLDVAEFQKGIQAYETVASNPNLAENPIAQNALYQMLFCQAGKPISVLMPYSTKLAFVADWYVQLWAESLGKAENLKGETVNVGATPLKAVGATDQHSQVQLYNEGPFDKVFTFISVETPDAELLIPDSLPEVPALGYLANQTFHKLLSSEFMATKASLKRNQRPSCTISLPKLDTFHFTQLLYALEVQTALAGAVLGIDPFNQPGVELGKKYTHALMGSQGYEHLINEAMGV